MDRMQSSEERLTVTELGGRAGGQSSFIAFDDGTYEAEYVGLKVFMDSTPWGEKKCARLYFMVTKGKYKGEKTTFKGLFFQDKETQAWVVGSKSKLADVIRAITGGMTIDETHKGTKVFIVVKGRVSKKNGNRYSNVESVIPRPADDEETISQSAESVSGNAQPASPRAQQAPQAQQARPVQKQTVVPARSEESSGSLLDDLTELSDFKE